MGLFGKKDKTPCPLCGGEVTGLFKTKIGGKQEICRECADKISMQKELLKNAGVEFVREHLAFREEQAKVYATLHFTHSFNFDNSLTVEADEQNRLVAIGVRDFNSWTHPLVFSYDDLTGYELWLQKKKLDDDKTSGETFAMSVSSALTKLVSTGSGNDTQFYTLKLKTANQYWPEMEILISVPKDLKYEGYQNNMAGIGQMLKCIVRKEPFSMRV
ncbi:hypothetical protein [Oscillibacter ruminantium]|uniref:hypothetical protein n=1 Tax=Oscillibacter ruminantium TaxID=1263547 RepID=UPI00030AD01E|nr:hypothetical protein [Oscillibacter ruminantium]MDN0031499.1 hypothetical protein [Oscillibacter valericigenes]